MGRLFPVVLFLCFSQWGVSPAGEEGDATKKSVGDLIKQLGDKHPVQVREAVRAIGRHKPEKGTLAQLKDLLKSPKDRVKWAAAEALWRLEHKPADLVPVYTKLLTATDADVRAASAWRLGRLGADAAPAVMMLAATLRDERFEVRVQAGQALANLGAVAKPALPALMRALGDSRLDDPSHSEKKLHGVRQSPALPALMNLADQAIPLLMESFRNCDDVSDDDDPKDRTAARAVTAAKRAALVFPAFGAKAIAPLQRALEDKDTNVRLHAAIALREMAQLNGLPDDAIKKLEKCLDDTSKDVRSSQVAAEAMSWVRPANTKAVTILAKNDEGFTRDKRLLTHLERMCPHNEAARKLLFKLLDTKHAESSQEAHRILGGLTLPIDQALGVWTKAFSHADSKVRNQAISALAKLGPSAKSVKSKLRERFTKETDHDCKGVILDALVAIDPDDSALVPFLIKAMDDSEWWIRIRAFDRLGDLGPKAKDALPKLKAGFLSPKAAKGERDPLDSSKMRHLLSAIVQIVPGSAETAATLLKALRNREIRAVLGHKNSWSMRDRLEDELHATMPAATPLLREALKDKDVDVRRSAALVLLRSGLDTKTALPVLMENPVGGRKDASDDRVRFQGRVVELLSRRSSVTPAVAEAWCAAWQTASPEVRTILEPGLLILQPEALPHLTEQLRTAKSVQSRRDLVRLLAQFSGQSKLIVPILRDDLRDPKPEIQFAAAQTLILLGPDAAEAIRELVPLLSSSRPALRAIAAKTLGGIGRAAKPALPALKLLLKDANEDLRIVAAGALGQIDPSVSEAFNLLRDVIASGEKQHYGGTLRLELSKDSRDVAIELDSIDEVIARYGERGVGVVADLLDDVDMDEWSAKNVSSQCGAPARVQAALLLAKLGPEAHKAVPALIRALDDRDPFIRDAAMSALGRIGPAAKEAASACIGLLEQQNRAASAGTWDSRSTAGGRSRAASRSEYGGPFDFRSLGREKLLSREIGFGYGSETYDPYRDIRPAYPYDPPHVLSRIDSEKRSAEPILREMAKDTNHPGRLSAALAMWRSGSETTDLIPAFTAAFEARIANVRNDSDPLPSELRECLIELGPQVKPALRVVAKWLKQRKPYAQEDDQIAVLEAFGRLGAEAKSEAGLLRPMLKPDRWSAKPSVAAALALYRITGEKDAAIPVLREVLMGPEERAGIYHWPDLTTTARVHAARALGVIAEKGDKRAEALIVETAKGDENPHVQVAALEALARLKVGRPAAIKGLCAALRHPVVAVRIEAASACSRLGLIAKSSAKALEAATEDSQLAVRQAARDALKAME